MLINKAAPFEDIRASARRSTLSMAENAWIRLRQGQTTLEELARMLPYHAIVDFREQHLSSQEHRLVAVQGMEVSKRLGPPRDETANLHPLETRRSRS